MLKSGRICFAACTGTVLGELMRNGFLSREDVNRLVAEAGLQDKPWIEFDRDVFTASYNRLPFLVNHRLDQHPKFTFAQLFRLCKRLPPNQVKLRVGKVPDDTDFDASLERFNQGLLLDDAMAHFEERQAYIVINFPERDPEYRPIIDAFLGEIAAQTEVLEPGLNWYATYIFITAQDSVTPYHMDREMNFLLQICGSKTVRLWDPFDDAIMTPVQKDRLLSDRDDPRPPYQQSFEAKAKIFELRPGLGVHHPFIAPHLVKTGPAPSISLAITFRSERSDVWTDAHRVNHRLRKFGLRPIPVGTSLLVDRTKAGLLRIARKTRKAIRAFAH